MYFCLGVCEKPRDNPMVKGKIEYATVIFSVVFYVGPPRVKKEGYFLNCITFCLFISGLNFKESFIYSDCYSHIL